jgi:hypothetical protein
MTEQEWFNKNKKRVMRQYRSNQGRSPRKEKTTFRVLKLAFIIFWFVILYFIIAGRI